MVLNFIISEVADMAIRRESQAQPKHYNRRAVFLLALPDIGYNLQLLARASIFGRAISTSRWQVPSSADPATSGR
jgi:hypothetical protein